MSLDVRLMRLDVRLMLSSCLAAICDRSLQRLINLLLFGARRDTEILVTGLAGQALQGDGV